MLYLFKKDNTFKKNIILFGLENVIQRDLFFSLLKNNHFVIGVFENNSTKDLIYKELYNLNILNCEFELFHLKNFNKDSFQELCSSLKEINIALDYLIYNPILDSYNLIDDISSSNFPKTLAKETSFLLRINDFFKEFFSKNPKIIFLSNPLLFSIKGYESNKAIYKQLKSLSKIILPDNNIKVISYYHSSINYDFSLNISNSLINPSFNENMRNNFVDFIEKDFYFFPFHFNFSANQVLKLSSLKIKHRFKTKNNKKTKAFD